jgi:hypothetical protein
MKKRNSWSSASWKTRLPNNLPTGWNRSAQRNVSRPSSLRNRLYNRMSHCLIRRGGKRRRLPRYRRKSLHGSCPSSLRTKTKLSWMCPDVEKRPEKEQRTTGQWQVRIVSRRTSLVRRLVDGR